MKWIKKNGFTLVLVIILLTGVGLLVYPTFSDYWNSFHQSRAIASYAQTVADMSQEKYEEILAAADASVGGKTAVDLPEGKNLVGAFHQPSLVYCDCGTFRTLPSGTFADGAAETIKHGLIADPAFFDFLLSHDMREEIEYVVRKNVEIKNTFVAADEFDRGRRQILNFGHTIGHTIEKNSDFTISHGRAVAIGMKASARAAYAFGLASEDLSGVISQALTRAGLDLACPFTPEQLTEAALHDKKRFDDTVNIIYLKKIGEPAIEPLPVAKLTDFLRAGLE